MQTKNLSLVLTETEWLVLCKDAGQELRNPKQHARFLLRQSLGIANDQPQRVSEQTQNGAGDRQVTASAVP